MSDRLPLILVPGLLCDETLWAHQIDALGDVAAMTVADVTRDESIEGMARTLLASAPERFALAGLSMGGYVAHAVMCAAPERVDRLALLDTSARPDTPEQSKRRKALIELAKIGRFKGVTPRLLPLLIHPDRQEDAALTEAVMAMAANVGRDAFLRQQSAILGRVDSRPYLADYALPTLVLVGREDALTPPEASEEMAALIPGARLVVVDACGHLSTMERPDETTAALRAWLTG